MYTYMDVLSEINLIIIIIDSTAPEPVPDVACACSLRNCGTGIPLAKTVSNILSAVASLEQVNTQIVLNVGSFNLCCYKIYGTVRYCPNYEFDRTARRGLIT